MPGPLPNVTFLIIVNDPLISRPHWGGGMGPLDSKEDREDQHWQLPSAIFC